MGKKFTVASDDKDDKRKGVKQGSKKDIALDKKRGVLDDKMKKLHKNAGKSAK